MSPVLSTPKRECAAVKSGTNQKVYRIIDANLNRSREGLRVCEEIARFVLDDKRLTEEFKGLRHKITDCIKFYPAGLRDIVSARDPGGDVGRGRQATERHRKDWKGVSLANIERVKESLRVLEEFSKVVDIRIADRFKRLRFKAYEAEKKLIACLPAYRPGFRA
jgi:thiamine-phosphate pyrophosphorylase